MTAIAKRGDQSATPPEPTHYGNPRYDPDRPTPVDVVELDIGGWIFFPALEVLHPQPQTGDAEVYETGDLSGGYLTVRHVSGNNDEYEFCFRVRGGTQGTATLTTLTRVEDGKDCQLGWIPDTVHDRVRMHHPNLMLEIPSRND